MSDALVIPPMRTDLTEGDNGDTRTAKAWYFYWRDLGQTVNAMSGAISFGSPNDRPNPGDVPLGALYVQDAGAGYVMYELQEDGWHYIGGTYWGTLSPDMRPTGLGTKDGGFTYRGTDQARTFVWSGTAWAETTPSWYGTHAARPAASTMAAGCLYTETDRGNVRYEVQSVSGSNQWVYVGGAMIGTVIAADQRPTALGSDDKGFLFFSTDSTQAEWDGGAWKAIGSLLDIGPAPPVSQFAVKANGLGGLTATTYAADNALLGFDVELDLPGIGHWKALDPTGALIMKNSGALAFLTTAGNTVGGPVGFSSSAQLNLTTGVWNFASAPTVGGSPISAGVTSQSGNLAGTSRVLGSNYTNGTSKPIFVTVTWSAAVIGAGIVAYTDSSGTPSTVVAQSTCGSTNITYAAVSFWVLPGNSYRVAGVSSPTLGNWIEWT